MLFRSITSEYDYKVALGYKIGSRWWGNGYTSEAAEAIINFMFENTDVERIDAYNAIDNIASGKVMEKVGMKKEGYLRNYYKIRDGFQDCTLFAIVRDDWKDKIDTRKEIL